MTAVDQVWLAIAYVKKFIKDARDWFRNDPDLRYRLYAIAQAALALAVIYGLLTAAYANAWLVLVMAVLNVSRKNVY
jgi:hypothetical protein